MRVRGADSDYVRLFTALPTPHVAVTTDMVVVDANDAYLDLFGLHREDIVGRPIISVFPPEPDSLDTDGTPFILQSFHRAAATGRPDPMPIARYDIADPLTGETVERYWSHVAVPVPGDDGRTRLVVQVLNEVTDYVLAPQTPVDPAQTLAWRSRAEAVEAQLLARAGEVREARAATERALALRAALAEVAVGMARAEDLEQLTAVLNRTGLATVGASAGAIGVRHGDVQLVRIASVDPDAEAVYEEVPLDAPLLGPVVDVEDRVVLLPDEQACADFSPATAEAVRLSGLRAVAGFPLRQGERPLGSLTLGWSLPQSFRPGDVEVMSALAAQCAQALARIQDRDVEKAQTAQAVQMSEALQRSLLTEPVQHPGFTVAARYRPARQQAEIGGDWYDSFTTAAGVIDLVVGDVNGHDQDAAALMGQVRNLLRGIAHTIGEPPAAIVGRLDTALRDLQVGVYTTAVLAEIEPLPGRAAVDADTDVARVRWTNAGHPAPLLVRRDLSLIHI